MSYGLEIRNASNQVTLSVTDSLTKYVGTFSIAAGASNGSATYADLAGGRPFATVIRTTTDPYQLYSPLITFSGTTVYWTFTTGSYNRTACNVVLGTY